ncbi:MAG: trypsin-like peptidase domain-containing protein [Planctomycetota bacterium]
MRNLVERITAEVAECAENKYFHSFRGLCVLCGSYKLLTAVLAMSSVVDATAFASDDSLDQLLAEEQARVEVIREFTPAVVAIFDGQGEGGGSGVIISPDGYALTNFHVTAPCGPAMKCGLADGRVYDAVIVGIDPVGDVGLIQLLGRDDFPTAPLGDSDTARVGDWVYVAGNPFLLADNLQPSISYGILSGVRRYQYPAGTLLEYADCLQTDAAINPGNSGGPLFDAEGRVIGINGRGSFEKRGRVNVGVGYAISINQIKRFLPMLKSGRILDHASFGATVATSPGNGVFVDEVLDSSDAYRRGLRYGDRISRFGGRDVRTANAFQNALAVYPKWWPVEVEFSGRDRSLTREMHLAALHQEEELFDLVQQEAAKPADNPRPPKEPEDPGGEEDKPRGKPNPLRQAKKQQDLPEAVKQRYTARRGYANYWYNLRKRDALWDRFQASTPTAPLNGEWTIEGVTAAGLPCKLNAGEDDAQITLPQGVFSADFTGRLDQQQSPPGSGGLLLAVRLWQRLLARGPAQYGEVYYHGALPLASDSQPLDCLVGLHAGVECRFYFDRASGYLAAVDAFSNEWSDRCRITFAAPTELDGLRVPALWRVTSGDREFATLTLTSWRVAAPAADLSEQAEEETP